MRSFILLLSLVITQSGFYPSGSEQLVYQSDFKVPQKTIENTPVVCDKHIIIGDSQTPFVDMNSQKAERISTNPGKSSLWEGGKTMSWLQSAVELYKVDSTVCSVVVVIGTNGGFGKFINDNPEKLFITISSKFPNSKIYAVQGSWGWGGLKNIKESDVRSYYNNWKQFDVTIIEPPIGKIEPHGNKPIYKKIGKNIDSLLNL